jgi:hypothetical protein
LKAGPRTKPEAAEEEETGRGGGSPAKASTSKPAKDKDAKLGKEVGGPKGPEPTRYGDWEKGGRCIDF